MSPLQNFHSIINALTPPASVISIAEISMSRVHDGNPAPGLQSQKVNAPSGFLFSTRKDKTKNSQRATDSATQTTQAHDGSSQQVYSEGVKQSPAPYVFAPHVFPGAGDVLFTGKGNANFFTPNI